MEDRAWYIAELAPGATRPVTERVSWARGKEVRLTRAPRENETAVEYALHDAGFSTYLPRMRKEIVHHRTHKTIVRTFPLFTGYAFIGTDALRPRFRDMLEANGVLRLLGSEGLPMRVPSKTVNTFIEAEQAMVFDDTREARIRRREEGRTMLDTIRMQFPAGSTAMIAKGPLAGFNGQVVDVHGKGIVKVMVELFGRLTETDIPVEQMRQVA